ncbi:MAG: 2-phospho-L-lactate guanylyltransferase [Chloroflexi bacterium]|nr:2-phospho-L-lactate guanylyltransferase [Chloroflexota bacterium]
MSLPASLDRGRIGPPERIVAIVPVRSLEGAKSRLGGVLDPEERRDLVVRLLERTIRAATAARRIAATITVSADPVARDLAGAAGAHAIDESGIGLVDALDTARRAAVDLGASAVLVLPIDLTAVSARALDEAIEAATADSPPDVRLVALVPDRHGRGTNLLFVRPPDAIDFAFGGDSRSAHATRARAAGARYVELGGPLIVDLDTPDDLLLAAPAILERPHAH